MMLKTPNQPKNLNQTDKVEKTLQSFSPALVCWQILHDQKLKTLNLVFIINT